MGLKAQSVGAWALAQLVIYLPNPTINPSKRLTNRHLLSLHDDYEVQKPNKRIPLNGKQEVERRGGVTKPSANNVRFIAFYYLSLSSDTRKKSECVITINHSLGFKSNTHDETAT